MTHDTTPAERQVSRRSLLKGSALGGFAAFLAACTGTRSSPSAGTPSGSAASGSPAGSPSPSPSPSATPKVVTGPLMFANWPAYIDLAGTAAEEEKYSPGSSPSLEAFKEKYDVEVDYQEKIGDNPSFMATIEPALIGNLPTPWDLIVVTDWMAAKIIERGWAEQIDRENTPTAVANLRDPLKGQAWDPNNDFHFPWQSGMTGVGYNAKALSENGIAEPTKIADLWAMPPDKVTFLTEARDTFGLGLLKLGIEPDAAAITTDDLQRVADDIQPLVDRGLRFADNSTYLQDFSSKKTWAAMVWSGDLASYGTEDDRFIFPEEGTMIWTDNMVIPKGAANKYTAELMIDYVYDPAVAAQIAAYVYYVSPVKGADEQIKALDEEAATNPLLFPTADIVAKQRIFQFLSPELEDKMDELYGTLSGT